MSETPQSNALASTNKLGRTFRGAADQVAATQAMLNLVADMQQGNYLMALQSGAAAAWAMTDLVGGQIQQKKFFQTDKTYLKSATLVLEITSYILTIVDQLNGSLPPDEGDIFDDGAKKFDTAVATLSRVNPNHEWQGEASGAYTSLRRQLIALIQEMAEVDREMKSVLTTEAEQVDTAHSFHRAVMYSVILTTPIALALYAKPIVGPAMSKTFQKMVARRALSLASDRLIKTADESTKNAATVKNLSERYQKVLGSASNLPKARLDSHSAPEVLTSPLSAHHSITAEFEQLLNEVHSDTETQATPRPPTQLVNTGLPRAVPPPNQQLANAQPVKRHTAQFRSPGNPQVSQLSVSEKQQRKTPDEAGDHYAQRAPVESEISYWHGTETAQAG
ncbi:MAG: hypothetical protein K2Q25_06160 [Mycobacteriaceae bacterium]|nr:hypothetical protein [Mycobacteriaceae bacterium]